MIRSDVRGARAPAQQLDQARRVEDRHHQVEHDQVGPTALHDGHGLGAIGRGLDW